MHSSRMRTARSLPYRRRWGGGSLSRGISVQWGSLSGGVSVWGGVSVRGGLCPGEGLCPMVCLSRGSLPGRPLDRYPSPLWTEWLTHACENITLAQTLFAGGNKYQQVCIPVWCVPPTSVADTRCQRGCLCPGGGQILPGKSKAGKNY